MATKNYGAVPTTEVIDDSAVAAPNAIVKKKQCNDVLFALLFVAHLAWVGWSWVAYAPTGIVEGEEGEEQALSESFYDRGVWKFVGVVTATALVLSTAAIVFMTTFSDELVEFALLVPVVGAGIVGIYGAVVWKVWMMVTGGIFFLLFLGFAFAMRKKIDFAAANLRTALTVIRTNFGLIVNAYLLEIVAFGWTVLWFNATGAVLTAGEHDKSQMWLLFLYLLSFFWVHQVINNLQHTIVAAVLGTWWYRPEDANSCWDDGLNAALCHSTTYSLGSICLGSLLAGTVQTLKWMHRLFAKRNNRCTKCIATCIGCCLICVQSMLEYFNKWAYAYIGIHGESYLTAGKEVIRLFKIRNWVGIIEDGMDDIVMWTMKITIALVTGLMGWWLSKYGDNDIFEGIGIDENDDEWIGFVAAALVGYIVSAIMMELVSSAVNAVIVCFAEAPAVFHQHHPALCLEMLNAWKRAYPIECSDDFDTVKV